MSSNRALQRSLDAFFKKVTSSDYSIREVTKGAFSQARGKLNDWGFRRLNEIASQDFYEKADFYYKWAGHRVLAVDGTRIMLPNHKSIKEEFGTCGFGPKADSERSMAIGSMLYDVLNQITMDAQLGAYHHSQGKSSSEKKLLEQHLGKIEKGDLLLLDRGYPSIVLFYQLKARGIEFCVRMKEGWWKEVRSFRDSGESERIVSFKLPKKDRTILSKYPDLIDEPIKCRLVRVELNEGEVEILCTSLLNNETYPHKEFKALYRLRWNEEEAYKLLKIRMELENFTGKTASAIKQDFHAKILLMTLAAVYAHPIEERVRKEYKADQTRKYDQKINRTSAIATTQDILVGLFIKRQFTTAMKAFDDLVYRTREIIRPDRKVERKHKPKKQYSMNYKKL